MVEQLADGLMRLTKLVVGITSNHRGRIHELTRSQSRHMLVSVSRDRDIHTNLCFRIYSGLLKLSINRAPRISVSEFTMVKTFAQELVYEETSLTIVFELGCAKFPNIQNPGLDLAHERSRPEKQLWMIS